MDSSTAKLLQRSLREIIDTSLVVDGQWGNISQAALEKYAQVFGVTTAIAQTQVLQYADKRFVSDAAFTKVSEALKVPESYVRAIAEVESRGDSFLKDGRVKILFERHKFYKYLREALVSSDATRHATASFLGLPLTSSTETLLNTVVKRYANVCNTETGGYLGGGAEWDRIATASSIHLEAAFMSASYGGYQLMGFNHVYCNFPTARAMAIAMAQSESVQFTALCDFIKSQSGMWSALRAANWARFAELYNGPAYKENNYDTKLIVAESIWAKQAKK